MEEVVKFSVYRAEPDNAEGDVNGGMYSRNVNSNLRNYSVKIKEIFVRYVSLNLKNCS